MVSNVSPLFHETPKTFQNFFSSEVIGLSRLGLVVASIALAALVVGVAYAIPQWMWQNTAARNPAYPQGPWAMWGGSMQWNGMMGGGCPYMGGWWGPSQTGQRITLQQAVQILEGYIGPSFRLKEVMEFQYNFYAVVVEAGTGVGAFELLVNPYTGAVMPEPGPNMMWNTKYGMHYGMMGGYTSPTADMYIPPEQAEAIALNYLQSRFTGAVEVEEPMRFYGYYTMDYKLDGAVHGMLSVNGFTGQVWYHPWHGQFIQEIEVE